MKDDLTHEILGAGGVRIAIIGTLAILALFLFAETATLMKDFGSGTPATNTITVTGSGQATIPPDVANISFTVQNTAASVSDAQAATTQQANDALAFVKGQGIADTDVTTLSYEISPQYSYGPPCIGGELCPVQQQKITGYQVSETIQVTVHDLSSVGSLLEGLGKLQVQNINGPAFALSDTAAGYDAARANAIDNAKAQAVLLANQLGVQLGKIVNFSESGNTIYPMPAFSAMNAATASGAVAAPSVPTGENTYSANVSITYEIR